MTENQHIWKWCEWNTVIGHRQCPLCFTSRYSDVRQTYEWKIRSISEIYATVLFGHTAAFEKVVEEHQKAAEEDLTESVDLVVADLPYNTCWEANHDNSDHYLLTSENIKQVSDAVDAFFVRRGHAVIFCFYVEFSECYNELSRITEKEEAEDDKDP